MLTITLITERRRFGRRKHKLVLSSQIGTVTMTDISKTKARDLIMEIGIKMLAEGRPYEVRTI